MIILLSIYNNFFLGLNIHLVSIFFLFYSIWSLFSFYVQLGPHFRQIVVNLVLFTNGV